MSDYSKRVPSTYSEAVDMLNGRKIKKNILNNTDLIRRIDGKIVLRYWSTEIVSYLPDGSMILTTGGYRTATTVRRLNAVAPLGVAFKGGHRAPGLYVEGKAVDGDTVVLGPDGAVQGAGYSAAL